MGDSGVSMRGNKMAGRKREYDVLPEISYGTKPKVLLVGNGINLSFPGARDTDSIIKNEWMKTRGEELSDRDSEKAHPIWKLPFPLQIVAATKNHVQSSMNSLSESFKKYAVTEDQKIFINEILQTGFDAILTTNYSLEFEKTTINNWTEGKTKAKYKTTKEQSSQQELFSIYRCTELSDNNHTLLWHIHGTAMRRDSMVIGQLYYGKLLAEVITRSNTVNDGYRLSQSLHRNYVPKSWIDYFLIGDLHILGFNLDYSEEDIWWLLSYKKSAFSDSKTFLYKESIEPEKHLLLNCYDISTPSIEFNHNKDDNNRYLDYYKRICSTITT